MAFRTNKVPVLQEKSASGSVASFNTALAMPLVNGEFSIVAYQEGSGDPSPVNVRAIVPIREVNIYQRGINQWDEDWERGMLDDATGINKTSTNRIRTKNYIPIQANTTYYINSASFNFFIFFFDKDKNLIADVGDNTNYIRVNDITFETPNNAKYLRFYSASLYGGTYNNNISINYPSTDTDYHAYTGNTYTIQLGQEVYGAEVGAVNGVAHCTHIKRAIRELTWGYTSTNDYFYSTASDKAIGATNVISDILQTKDVSASIMPNYSIKGLVNANSLLLKCTDYTNVNDLLSAIGDYSLVYELAEPFDIQLTPTQIETLIGNNTIFADTGDIDLTYKDLDIAKRGNFREVFKLPS